MKRPASFRILSHFVRLLPLLLPLLDRVQILLFVHLRHQDSSNDGAVEGSKMRSVAHLTFLYSCFWINGFVSKASVRQSAADVLYCKCSKECWRRAEMRYTAHCLQNASHYHQESEWKTHRHIFIKSRVINCDLGRLHSHQQLTGLEFIWTVPHSPFTTFSFSLVESH